MNICLALLKQDKKFTVWNEEKGGEAKYTHAINLKTPDHKPRIDVVFLKKSLLMQEEITISQQSVLK